MARAKFAMECGGKRSATPLSLGDKSGLPRKLSGLLPHSKDSRIVAAHIRRASVLECGSPMPL